MGGSPDGSSEAFVARMQQLINKLAMTGSRGNCYQSYEGLIPAIFFTANKTELYWCLLPDKTHAVAGEVCRVGKKSKERVTVLVCANMSGSEKLSLLTIGKFKKPWSFRGVMCLPTVYEANTSAWIYSKNGCGSGMQSSLVIIAILHSSFTICSAHPRVQGLQSIKLIFFLPNTTSEIQPCDQGIIQALKVHYRKNMVKCLITSINSGSTAANFKITLWDGLQMLRRTWESFTDSTISNCFCKEGFILPLEPEVEEKDPFVDLDAETASQDDPMCQLEIENLCSFDKYSAVDNGLQYSPMSTNQDIVSSVMQVSEEHEEGDDTGDPLPSVTYKKAYSAFQVLRSYLFNSFQKKESESLYGVLSDMESRLFIASNKACVQTNITDYKNVQ